MNQVLTGSVASFCSALAVRVTYAAGMVAPPAVLAQVWEGRDWGSSRLLDGRRVWVGCGLLARTIALGTLASPRDRERADLAGVVLAPGILLDGRPFGCGRLSERKLRSAFARQHA